nr:MAG TPA: 5'-AMP-activated protein kinase catalytic subunit [Caudoviricetes sp.]
MPGFNLSPIIPGVKSLSRTHRFRPKCRFFLS